MIVIEEEEEEEEPFPFTQEAARDMTLEIQAMQDMLDADAWAPGAMPHTSYFRCWRNRFLAPYQLVEIEP